MTDRTMVAMSGVRPIFVKRGDSRRIAGMLRRQYVRPVLICNPSNDVVIVATRIEE